ncbi:spore coat putative kinase YutH [Fervidibacillus albus]|uniref:Spore coat protein YutH n=1 Tax=Fervidibacillus albus TaxID=2980026 RepID=A0A9E8LUX7_9BACI|nr:spore coat protein YutH [Fervidibacillus albus]WAA09952.1 spore coat protein YutH [Fervidibacillus albus]
MVFRVLQKQYGLNVEKAFSLSGYKGFQDGRNMYVLIPVSESQQGEIVERFYMVHHMHLMKERDVPFFQPTKNNHYIGHSEEKYFVLLKMNHSGIKTDDPVGVKLARFHLRGMSYPYPVQHLNRLGKWKDLWVIRQQEMENLWQRLLKQKPTSPFEHMFVESYSYYSGFIENAIQYFVDTSIDERPERYDRGTITHERFTYDTWFATIHWKNPFLWVFDHPSRDLAEWVRQLFFNELQLRENVRTFFMNYQSVTPLSSFSWRLILSRLLFPVHFIECVELYYSTNSEAVKTMMEKRLERLLAKTGEYERFLFNLFELANHQLKSTEIPVLDWLTGM